ncbi:NAD(P)H-dependent glycerol-3-phosphate dehydrogenase [Sneathiella sp.]|jgi:glycerol-3-phosphate dehydrogenase (NAD(P)+)|uniref:NAD(P)H-dependent glycerol-3-phosphate dehydrogenase n=1 Tax=Sneathiella sp. TaxID=1964365 RepID=UPI0039E3ED6F
MDQINVIGAGAWGTALAISMAGSNRQIKLGCRHPEQATSINTNRENKLYLSDVSIPQNVTAVTDIAELCRTDILLNVTPAQYVRDSLKTLAPHLKPETALVICAKGIEKSTGQMMSEVVTEIVPGQPFAILSGPNFAREVANNLPAATTLATSYKDWGPRLTKAIGQPTFRPYYTDDVVGAQMGGAIKNVLAIACGIVAGAQLGENARAALITRGMAEVLRLGEKLGGRAETLMGLSGLGDLVLTCSSSASRNFSLGEALGQGHSLESILGTRKSVTEGVHTAAALCKMADKHKIEMPICAAVNSILNEGAAVKDITQELLARPFRDEKLAGF